ncbi:MAG: DUF5667 domain-containing protein [Jatrophihabitans sp.]|uniref:DUF5667 domain-containing protein n=1 Tax=Jatrophihabitans sp. TaxID=1932789 RepID=UPI00391204BB
MAEHRVTMLGASWRRFEDPTRSRDPRVLAVVGALATLPAVPPRAEFRAELRAQLVAITPRIVAESAEAATGLLEPVADAPARARKTAGARHADGFLARLRGVRLGRPLTIAASLVTAFVVLLGGAVYMSRKALPGDALYGLKRASERVELATAGSATEKAKDHLDFAATRAREVQALLSRASARSDAAAPKLDPDTARLVASALGSADADVTAASVLLGKQAVSKKSTAPLSTMTKWAPGQLDRLRDIAALMPSGALQSRTESSANLVAAALTRAETLAPKVDCSCLRSTGVDSLGPVPCTTCPPAGASGTDPSNPQPGNGGGQGGTGAGSAGGKAGSGATGGTSPNSTVVKPHSSATPNQPAPQTTNPPAIPGLPLPTIKLPTSSLPVNVSSCSLGVSVGPLNLGVGLCTLGISVHP